MAKFNSILRRVAVALAAALLLQGCMLLFDDTPSEPSVFLVSGETTVTALDTLITLNVTCDSRWTVNLEEGGEWLTLVSPSNGKGKADGIIKFKFDYNKYDEARTAAIVVNAGSRSSRKDLTQAGFADFFNPAQVSLAGTVSSTLSFMSPYSWAAVVSDGSDWFSIDKTSGQPGKVNILVTAKDPNENVGSRTGKIALGIGELSFTIPVVQSQKDIVLADKAEAVLAFTDTEFSVLTQSNVNYTIETSANWIHHVRTKALNEATEVFTVDENPGETVRTAQVSFKAQGASTVTITVKQEGLDNVLRVRTPGLYGVNGANYVLGEEGWNMSSRVKGADGAFEYRLLNSSALRVLRTTGIDTSTPEGMDVKVHIVMQEKNKELFAKDIDATVIGQSEDILWLKNSASTYFVIQK